MKQRTHAKRPGASARFRAGFTLIEMVISSALMAVILTAAYVCMSAAVESRKTIEPRSDIIQGARVVLALMAADLRAACPLNKGPEFLGVDRVLETMESDNVDFATHNYSPQRPGEGDFCSVSYYLGRTSDAPGFSLWRRRNPALAFDPLSGGSREELARGIAGLKLEYYDGFDWFDTWGDVEGKGKRETSLKEYTNLSGLPEAVRITLWFDSDAPPSGDPSTATSSRAPPLAFQTIARIELPGGGAAGSGSSGSGSSAGGGSGSSRGTTQGAPQTR